MRVRLFSKVTKERSRGNSFTLLQGDLGWRWGKSLPWEGDQALGQAVQGSGESPALEVLRGVWMCVSDEHSAAGLMGDLGGVFPFSE